MTDILVVDDESYNLDIIAEFLRHRDYNLQFAMDGESAWQLIDRHDSGFHALILDRLMPGMNGIDLLRCVKADPRFADMPVIMQTSATEPGEVAEGLAAGAWYYLAKPFQRETLDSIVAAALEVRGNQRELSRLSQDMEDLLDMSRQLKFSFSTPAQARLLANTLSRLCPGGMAVSIGLTELALNAIEHGNLGIDYQQKGELLQQGRWQQEIEDRLRRPPFRDRRAQLTCVRHGDRIEFLIEDQGDGFDWHQYLEIDPKRAFDSHGRGIALARQLAFQSLDYRGRGNRVLAVVPTD
jgi:CheY-like chemotaxis protein